MSTYYNSLQIPSDNGAPTWNPSHDPANWPTNGNPAGSTNPGSSGIPLYPTAPAPPAPIPGIGGSTTSHALAAQAFDASALPQGSYGFDTLRLDSSYYGHPYAASAAYAQIGTGGAPPVFNPNSGQWQTGSATGAKFKPILTGPAALRGPVQTGGDGRASITLPQYNAGLAGLQI